MIWKPLYKEWASNLEDCPYDFGEVSGFIEGIMAVFLRASSYGQQTLLFWDGQQTMSMA